MAISDKKDAVSSLEDVCVRYLCKNITQLTYCDESPDTEPKYRWRFPSSSFFIGSRPAQKILLQLCKRNALDDKRISLFSAEYVDLRSPVLKDVNLSSAALRVFKDFHLSNFSAINLPNVKLSHILCCLGEWSVRNMISLDITGISIQYEPGIYIHALGRFKNLQVLNVSRTAFTTTDLHIVADYMTNLQYLNVSRSRVTKIHPLVAIRDRLTGLIMHRLELEQREDVEDLLRNIVKLHELRILDVSDIPLPSGSRFVDIDQLCSGSALPHLTHIDLSGNQFGLTFDDAKALVENHANLVFVGFASWLSSRELELQGIYALSQKYPHITMLGDRGDKLLLNTLTRNKDRAVFLQNALHSLFEVTSDRESVKPDLLHAVLRVMRLHMRRMEMVLAGTAVIYNLTRSEQSSQLPLDLLNRAVRMTLTAMEKFPTNRQLQKNCLLTLCSDTVLYRATFSCIQCCELVFNNLISFNDTHMLRMGVAIISILAAEISTVGLAELAKDRRRIHSLLVCVSEKCLLNSDMTEMWPNVPEYMVGLQLRAEGPPLFDTTLRFTLSALWNLTDECPEACLRFVKEGGLQIYERVLKRFADQEDEVKNHVYTKCLGLLNNVAEVSLTRSTLLIQSLMDFFFKMLHHPSIQISYFAAGIIAHLSCLKDDEWQSALECGKEAYISQLGLCVCNWQPPQSEMVAYRSFAPFEQLVLHPESRLEVHLWAVWAIHHILTRKETRYVPTLRGCSKLLNFLRHLISVDETVLCTGTIHQHLSSSSSMHSHHGSEADTCHSMNVDDTDSFTSDRRSSSPIPCSTVDSSSAPSRTVPPPNHHSPPRLSSAGDEGSIHSINLTERDTADISQRRMLCSSTPPGLGHTTYGVSACAGPNSSQMICARLVRSLAAKIISVVDRFNPTTAVEPKQ